MSEQKRDLTDISEEDYDSDSRVDMWCSVALVLIAWLVALYWVSGQ